jgi:hypothetical protein
LSFVSRQSSVVTCAAVAALLCGCGSADEDEIQAEATAILERVPLGTPFMDTPAAMGELGFSCAAERREITDAQGGVLGTESHFSCAREHSQWLICTRRTRVVLLQLNGKLSNILVNVGRFCS